MTKIACAILGSGNIGTDLMAKVLRSDVLELTAVVGIDPQSEGLALAASHGLEAPSDGIAWLEEHPDRAAIVFDATSARAHLDHAPRLKRLGMRSVDLTPAKTGPGVVPTVNLEHHVDESDINLITCGGQATIPVVAAVSQVAEVTYAEIVSTVASLSAGPGTRQNIDEFTAATAQGLEEVGGALQGKAIIILNPAEPPLMMRNTIYCQVAEGHDPARITQAVGDMVRRIQEYVPGYRLRTAPIVNDGLVTVLVEVEGAGDYLPPYAGNLDIMTAAATRTGEALAPFVAAELERTRA